MSAAETTTTDHVTTYARALELAERVRTDGLERPALEAIGYPSRLAGQTGVYCGRAVVCREPLETVPTVVVNYMGQRHGSARLVVPETGTPEIQVTTPAPAAERALADLLAHLTGGPSA